MQWHPSRSSSFTMALGGGPWSLPLGSVFCLHVFRWGSPFLSTKLLCSKLQVVHPEPPGHFINCPWRHTARGISLEKIEEEFNHTQDTPLASCWEFLFFDPNGNEWMLACGRKRWIGLCCGWKCQFGNHKNLLLKVNQKSLQRLFIWPNRQTPDTRRLQWSLETVHHSDAQVMCDRDMTCWKDVQALGPV